MFLLARTSLNRYSLFVLHAGSFSLVYRRDDLIEKTMQDIPSLSRAQAEEEVGKFLLDQEAVQMYINFGKAKEDDPEFVVPEVKEEEEGPFSFRNIVIGYLGYVVATSVGPKFFRKWVGQQQEAGTWTGTGIQAVDDWIANTPIPAAPSSQAVVDVASSATASSSAAASDAVSAASIKIAPVVAESAASATASAASALQAAAADVAATVTEAATQASSSDAGQSLFDVASGVFQ
jgi:hypothetical protein